MSADKKYLYNMYNGTSTDDGKGDLETYENWLERQLLSRIKKLDEIEKYCQCIKPKPNYPEMVWCDECRKELKQ